jgi:WD40 repeat protein
MCQLCPACSRHGVGGLRLLPTVKLWDAGTGSEQHTLRGHSGPVNAVVFSPDGKTVASASNDYTVKLWDAGTGTELRTLQVQAYISILDFSMDLSKIQSCYIIIYAKLDT